MQTNTTVRMPFYLPGSPRFVQALQLFLEHTTEYEMLRPWYDQFLNTIPRKHCYLDIGTGNGASLTNQADRQFKFGIGVEQNEELLPIIREHCPNIQVIGTQWEELTDEQLFELVAQQDPTLNVGDSSHGTFDLVQLVHLLYYLPVWQHFGFLRRVANLVRPGGVIFAALQDDTSEYYKLYHDFTPYKYNLRHLAEWFECEFSRRGWEVTSEVLPGEVATDNFDVARQIAEFMLCYVSFDPLPEQSEIESWVKEHLWKPERGLYVAQNPQRVMVCRRLDTGSTIC